MKTTYVRKRKRPMGCGLWPSYEWEADEFGTWLFTPAHSRHRGDDGAFCEVAQRWPGGPGEDALHLVPRDGWWFATWRPRGLLVADVSTQPVLVGDEWTYVDLELDPYRRPDGTVGTEDWDELAEAQAAGLIDDHEHRAAVEAAHTLEQQFTDGIEPFGTTGWTRLSEAIALELPPLTNFGNQPIT
ncbi:DUF402 domain-containing protein [Kribbella sp. NPDC050281]|uniref:DUF402 domain-containing protein n=1 Tax=Kribbella sp. NPDC050281 TaxID=3155515 RepID=UPI00340A6766